MKILAVYVGRESRQNLEHGLRAGIWGFKDHAKPERFQTLNEEDVILLATGFTGGSPRTSFDEWRKHALEKVWYARIDGTPFHSTQGEWPDETSLPEHERYCWRLRFDPTSVQTLSDVRLNDQTLLSLHLAEQLRRSGSANGRGYIVEEADFPGMTQQSAKMTPRFWVEKTIVKNRPDRQNGDHALGKALWSPHKAEDGKNIYYNMLSLKPDDIVFHFVDNERIEGYSIVAKPADSSFIGITGTEWGDRPAHRVELRDHHKLDISIERDEFLQNPTYQPLLKNLLDSEEGLFFNRKFNANQGAYLTQAPLRLVQIWNDINLQKTGQPINPDWNIPPLGSVEPNFGPRRAPPPLLQTKKSSSPVLFIRFGTQ